MGNDVMTIAGTIAELRERAEKAERERDEAKATLETYRSVAGVAERTAEELRVARRWVEAHALGAKCVPVREDWTPTLASRLEKLEARVVPVFCSTCGAAYALGMPPACGHGVAVNAALTDATATNEALRAEIMSVNRELAQAEIRANYHANRVAIIEEERDAHKGDLDAELSGNAALRRDFGARDDETMCEFVARLARERDEARKQLSDAVHEVYRGHRVPSCPSCEGPLTCAKCVPVFTQEFMRRLSEDAGCSDTPGRFDEARIKEMADKVKALERAMEIIEARYQAERDEEP
jgi:hypothetical protein